MSGSLLGVCDPDAPAQSIAITAFRIGARLYHRDRYYGPNIVYPLLEDAMRQRFIVLLAVLTVISGWGLPRSQAQGPAPQTYSLTEDPGWGAGEPHVVKLSRDGSKEVVEQIIPPGPGGPATEFRAHTLYDFQAHKMYYKILSDPSVPCSVQNEEHTLNSSHRCISYAVFCLKKKKIGSRTGCSGPACPGRCFGATSRAP